MTWACFSRKCICFQHHFRKSKWLFVGSDWVCLGYLEHHFVSLNFVLGMPFCKWGTCDPIFHSYIFGTQLLPLYTIEDTVYMIYILRCGPFIYGLPVRLPCDGAVWDLWDSSLGLLVWFLRFPWEWEEALQRFRECFKGFGTLRFNMRNM